MSDLQFISTIPSSTSQRPEQLHEATQERQKTLTKRGSTPRTQRLRDISESTHPSISLERALIETDVYRKYEGKVPTPVLRGLFFKTLMERRTLYLGDDELIVGEKGTSPQSAPTFPELCCHTIQDFNNMNDREHVSFKVAQEDKRIQQDIIIPFWEQRATMTKMYSALPQSWHLLFKGGMFTEFMAQRGPGHTVADGKIYGKGYVDCITDIDAQIARIDYNHDMDSAAKKAELQGMKLTCEGMIILGKRYAQKARDMATCTEDAQRQQELLDIAHICERVPAHAPTTFREAIQMYWFTHIGVTNEMNNWDSYSPGKLDQHLQPFYERGLRDATLTREQARELLECLWIKFNNQPAPPKVGITLKESATYTDFCNINTGALKADGSCGISDVSYLILDVMDEMKLLQPSSNVQISRKTPEHFLHRACEISRKGWGQPAFYNSDALIQELLGMGKTLKDAHESGIASGCVEVGTAGKEAYVLTGYLNIPKVLELVLNRGFDHYSNKQIGPDVGNPREFSNFDELYAAFERELRYVTDIKVAGNNLIERLFMDTMPVPLQSVITDDCIASAKDYNCGGARYNTSYIQCVGIATIADSLAVLRKHVFADHSFSMSELIDACNDDFRGSEKMLDLVKNHTPKYGNDDEFADSILREVDDSLQAIIAGRPTPKGARTIVEFLPTTCHVYFGQTMTASPNGRRAHIPLPDGISPEKGADLHGPTAVIRSAAKINQLRTGGALLNQKFTPSVVAGKKGILAMSALIRAYFTLDGHHLQFNVVDRATLIDAQKHPLDYTDLIVRVAGYSDYFNNLDKALQDEIIARTEQAL
ncbi:trans-4-hydroxy-L-proline dehydratase [Bifidobacterium aquikefiri]|uniref:trans-4-hydroxy-L-proline dehydratase n=1 Tax=Bifidobacterium aquikefiri TaxID=1653207 RepID=UPI0023F364B4|nr:trans-4-hydroxy-L-proline dehydratase [Bifidobacterium aquikefiri]